MVNNRILAPHQHLLEILNRRASTWNITVFSRIRGFLSEEKFLKGRVAMVTSGASGMGRAMALALAEAGADVAIGSRS